MTTHRPDEDPQITWQSQHPEQPGISAEEIRARAMKLRRHARRTMIKVSLMLVLLVVVPLFLSSGRGILARVLFGIAGLWILYQNYATFRAGSFAVAGSGMTACRAYYRQELERRAGLR